MKLIFRDDEFPEASSQAVGAAIQDVEADETLTLEKSDSAFLDAFGLVGGLFSVQYREGGVEDIWVAPGEGVDRAMLRRLFLSYLAGDEAWRTLVAWEANPEHGSVFT